MRRALIAKRLTVRDSGDHLEIERGSPKRDPLVRVAEHRFDTEDGSQSFDFTLEADGRVEAVIVIRDGEPSDPGPRLVPLPQPDADLVEAPLNQLPPVELGHICLCGRTADVEKAGQ